MAIDLATQTTLDLASLLTVSVPEAAGEVVYTSSNPEIASIENGTLTALKKGTVTITASIKDSETYNNVSSSFNLTISDSNSLDEVIDFSSKGYENGQSVESFEQGIFSLLSPGAKYYTSDSTLRFYKTNNLTISIKPGYYITKIDFGATVNTSGPDCGTLSGTIWTPKENEYPEQVVFPITETSKIKIIKIYCSKAPAKVNLSFAEEAYSVNYGESFTAPALIGLPEGSTATYSSSDESVATVAADGTVTVLAVGSTVITAAFAGNADYAAAEASYTLNVLDASKETVEIVWNLPESININETLTLADYITVTPEAAKSEVVFTSSLPENASIENGVLTAIKKGNVTLTADIKDSEAYNDASVSFDLTIINPYTKNYTLLSSLENLGEVTPVIIVCSSKNVAFGTDAITSDIKYGNSTGIELTDGIIVVEDGTEAIQLFNLHKSTDGKYAFEFVNGVNAGKYLSCSTAETLTLSDNLTTVESVTITDGDAAIYFGSSAGTLKYNSSNPRFTTYVSGQTAIQLFTLEPKTPTFSGWRDGYCFTTGEEMTVPAVTTNSDAASIKYEIYDQNGNVSSEATAADNGDETVSINSLSTTIGIFTLKATTEATANFKAGETSTVIEIISGDVTAEGFDFTTDVNVYGMTTDPAEDAFESAVNELVHEGGNVTIFFEKGNNFRHVTHADGYKALEVAAGHSFFIKATNGNRLTSVIFDGLDNFDVEENGKPTPAQPANAPRRAAVAGNGWTAPASDGNSADITSLKVTVPAGAENAFIKTINFSTAKNTATGVEEIATESVSEIYTINGVRVNGTVDTLAPGLYILREGTRTVKILVK